MLYRITHTTRFEYEEPAYDSQNELRMRPWDRDGQRCLAFDITTNEPSSTLEYGDFFGNRAHSVCVAAPHRKLEIVARSIVELDTPPLPGETGVTLAEFLRDDSIRNNVYFEYLNPSQYIPFSERLRKFFWMAKPQEHEEVGLYVARIMAYVRDQFEYETTATHVHSSLNDILDSGGGVCQDFAHLTIGILRLAGVPARYVSGYLAPANAGYLPPAVGGPPDRTSGSAPILTAGSHALAGDRPSSSGGINNPSELAPGSRLSGGGDRAPGSGLPGGIGSLSDLTYGSRAAGIGSLSDPTAGSGYPPGTLSPPDVTAQASHAWLEAWLPGTGWSGFDPTHRCAVDGRHIGVAVGRDYADVPPLRGVFRSDGVDSMMFVDLSVEPVKAGPGGGGSGGHSQSQQ
jgi:transglutaminase-like putative cysteine protease